MAVRGHTVDTAEAADWNSVAEFNFYTLSHPAFEIQKASGSEDHPQKLKETHLSMLLEELFCGTDLPGL